MKNVQITTLDNIELNASYFEANSLTNKIVLISPATGVKKHIYNVFAEYLNQQGFAVLTWDWRGIADNLTVKIKDNKSCMEDWAKKDLNAMINWASTHLPDYKIFAVGHSFGGQGFGMAPDIKKVQSVVTVATQSGY
jgi:predicted alpha/beta hydrolase